MLRAIIASLLFLHPAMPRERAVDYAKLVRRHQTPQHDWALLVSLVHYESGWTSRVVNQHGCVGLGQICVQSLYPECQGNLLGGKACAGRMRRLMDPNENLRVVAQHMRRWQAYCRRKVGRGGLEEVLAGYQGVDHVQGTTCGHRRLGGQRWRKAERHRLTSRVLTLRRKLIARRVPR